MSRFYRFRSTMSRAQSRFGGKLYKDPSRSIISGVCSGFAAWLGIRLLWVRLAVALAFCFAPLAVIIGYVALAFILSPRPVAFFTFEEEALKDRYNRAFMRDRERGWRS
jgi:phage shock protein PspC (stress-responsive transcriptional regulator)